MDISTATVSPLRQRMLNDMRKRKMAKHTQDGYIRAVRKLAAFLGRSPDTATIEELRRFQLHLVDAATGPVDGRATEAAVTVMRQVAKAGGMKVDVVAYPDALANRDFAKKNFSAACVDRMRVAGVKLVIDGSL